MTAIVAKNIADVRKRGAEVQAISAIAFYVLAAGVVGEIVVAPVWDLVKSWGAAPWDAWRRDFGVRWVDVLPAMILMGGLWCAQRLFGRVGAGDVFTAANARDLERIGASLGWCALFVFFEPMLKALITRSPDDIDFEFWAIVLSLLGGAVVLVGRIWGLAVEVKAENDQIV